MDGLPSGYGASLLQSLLALAAVTALAWVVLRGLARTGFGQGSPLSLRGATARIEVIERRALDAQRVLWIVRVSGRSFLIGAGDGGAPAVLAELGDEPPLSLDGDASGRTFAEVLADGGVPEAEVEAGVDEGPPVRAGAGPAHG